MCEPTNSIVQYPPQNDGGAPTETLLQPSFKERVFKWGKKVLGFLHYCKMGSGHHEAIQVWGTHYALAPHETRYEGLWWDRKVKLDGEFHGEEFDKAIGLEAAEGYAEAVSIGSMTALRRFLETSMRKSDAPYMYMEAFLTKFLNERGREYATQRLKTTLNVSNLDLVRLFGCQYGLWARTRREAHTEEARHRALDTAIKVMLGITRKRNLLVSAWADDDRLWTPGQKGMEGQPSPQLGVT